MSCIIAGFLIEYQLKWSQRCLRLLLLQASLIRDLMLPFPAYIGIDPSKRTYTPFLPLGMLAMFSLFRAHIVPYCLTIRMNSPFAALRAPRRSGLESRVRQDCRSALDGDSYRTRANSSDIHFLRRPSTRIVASPLDGGSAGSGYFFGLPRCL
jgi:hypothetical protein